MNIIVIIHIPRRNDVLALVVKHIITSCRRHKAARIRFNQPVGDVRRRHIIAVKRLKHIQLLIKQRCSIIVRHIGIAVVKRASIVELFEHCAALIVDEPIDIDKTATHISKFVSLVEVACRTAAFDTKSHLPFCVNHTKAVIVERQSKALMEIFDSFKLWLNLDVALGIDKPPFITGRKISTQPFAQRTNDALIVFAIH